MITNESLESDLYNLCGDMLQTQWLALSGTEK
jgi:hypothetical protein